MSLGGTLPEEEGEVTLPPPGSGYVVEFALDQDGLGFRNYGSRFPEGDLTADDVRSLFGEQVCVAVEGGSCTPTPAAQIWIDTMTDYMRAGHCAGFTVSASRFRLGELTPVEFIPDAQHPFEIDQNVAIMRQIARDWVLQVTPEVSSQAVTGTPRQIIDQLLEKKALVDLGIFSRSGGGHSVLAYGVEDQGEGLFHILIYDNNWPGQPLYVEVNYLANTWRYSLAATDPSQDAGAWDGDARTRSLMYVPFEAYLQPVSCPFCPAEGEGVLDLALSGAEAHLTATDAEGNQAGYVDGEFVAEIPGAELVFIKDTMYQDRQPIIVLPSTTEVETVITARPGYEHARSSLRMLGGGVTAAIEGLAVENGASHGLTVSEGGASFAFAPGSETSPVFKIGAEQEGGSATLATLAGATVGAGGELALTIDPANGNLEFGGTGVEGASLILTKMDENGTEVFATDNVSIPAGGALQLDVAGWDGSSPLQVAVDATGSGAFVAAEPLENQPLSAVLAGIDSAETMGLLLSTADNYLSEEATAEVLAVLGESGFSGSEIGGVLAVLASANLDTAAIADFVSTLALPAGELANVVSGLPLDPAGTEALVGTLDLPAETLAELKAGVALNEQADALANEIEFGRLQEDPAGLAAFLSTQEIPIEVLGKTLGAVDLPVDRLATVLTESALPPAALAAVLNEMSLPPQALATVINEVNLSPEELTVVAGNLALSPESAVELLSNLAVPPDTVAELAVILELSEEQTALAVAKSEENAAEGAGSTQELTTTTPTPTVAATAAVTTAVVSATPTLAETPAATPTFTPTPGATPLPPTSTATPLVPAPIIPPTATPLVPAPIIPPTATPLVPAPTATPTATPSTVANRAPVANAGADQSGLVNQQFTLTGSGSSDPDGNLPLLYSWTQSAGQPVGLNTTDVMALRFTAPMSPTVLTFRLTVTDSRGLAGSPDTVVITVADAAIVGLAAANSGPTVLGSATALTATVNTTATNVVYAWNFGDGTAGSGANPNKTYTAVGSYTATVTATNSVGQVTASTRVTVIDRAIVGLAAAHSGPTVLGSATALTATLLDGSNVSYVWAFGDGASGSGVNASRTYAAVGSYTATVTATNGVSQVTASTQVTVIDRAIVGLAAAHSGPTVLGSATRLTATVAAGTNVGYTWNFGDGSPVVASGSGVSATLAYTYAAAGNYTATVTATNGVGPVVASTRVTV
ncbi:MAG: PKD domain-containing protein, partial [Caldilinea sp.]